MILHFAVFFFLFSAFDAAPSTFQPSSSSEKITTRIIGGTLVQSPTPWPWIGYLVSPGCGVNIINEQWVVTAAHCVLDGSQASGYMSAAAAHMGFGCLEKGSSSCSIYGANEIVPHPCYDTLQEHDDIALIHLDKPLDMDMEYAQLDYGMDLTGKETTLIGWGSTSPAGLSPSKELRQVSVTIASPQVCSKANPQQAAYELLNFTRVFCTGGIAGKDSCSGDSGGPAVVQGGDGTWYLAGLASFGSELPDSTPNCAVEGRYGVYTRVSQYKMWVDAIVSGAKPVCNEAGFIPAAASTRHVSIFALACVLFIQLFAMFLL